MAWRATPVWLLWVAVWLWVVAAGAATLALAVLHTRAWMAAFVPLLLLSGGLGALLYDKRPWQ